MLSSVQFIFKSLFSDHLPSIWYTTLTFHDPISLQMDKIKSCCNCFLINILFRSDMSGYSSKIAFANGSFDFNYAIHLCDSFILIARCLGSFIVWSTYLLCQHFLAARHKTFLVDTQHKWELFHTAQDATHFLCIWTAPLPFFPAPRIQRRRGFVCSWVNASFCRTSHETLDSNSTPHYLLSFFRNPHNIPAPWLLFVLNLQAFWFEVK